MKQSSIDVGTLCYDVNIKLKNILNKGSPYPTYLIKIMFRRTRVNKIETISVSRTVRIRGGNYSIIFFYILFICRMLQ